MAAQQLTFFSDLEFEDRVPDGYPVSCPTLDLATIWDSIGKHVLICRPPGQIVSKIHQLGRPGVKAPEAVATAWKADGM